MPAGSVRLASDIGVSLEISEAFAELADAEVGSVCLAAWAEPWPWPHAFRPNLTVEVEPLTPQTATIAQLSTRTIAGQIALGRHVTSCDYLPDAPDGGARNLVAVYPASDTTVIQLQHVALRGNRAVIVTMQHGAGNHADGVRTFDRAVKTLECAFDDPPVSPDPATMPRLDPFAVERGEALEDLSGVRARQPFVSAGPALTGDQLESLRRGKVGRGVDATALQSAGLIDDRHRLTELGQAARQALTSPQRRVTLTVCRDGDPQPSKFEAYQRTETTAILADPPPGDSAAGGRSAGPTLDLIATQTTAVAMARWLGLAPAWTFAIDDDAFAARLDTSAVEARLRDPATAPPATANAALVRMWSEPWQVVTLRATHPPLEPATVVMPALGGPHRLERSHSEARLIPLPGIALLRLVLAVSGFDLGER